jgi:REP element-mobilizing transposase RayT
VWMLTRGQPPMAPIPAIAVAPQAWIAALQTLGRTRAGGCLARRPTHHTRLLPEADLDLFGEKKKRHQQNQPHCNPSSKDQIQTACLGSRDEGRDDLDLSAKSNIALGRAVVSGGAHREDRVEQGQVELVFRTRGGKRRGAGRKPKGKRSSERHKARLDHDPRHPVHVTIRIVGSVGGLRCRDLYLAIREATIVTARREDFRIIHMSIQRDHLHLLVGADSKAALSKGVQGFSISAARQINKAITARGGERRTGKVIGDRFHAGAVRGGALGGDAFGLTRQVRASRPGPGPGSASAPARGRATAARAPGSPGSPGRPRGSSGGARGRRSSRR